MLILQSGIVNPLIFSFKKKIKKKLKREETVQLKTGGGERK